MHTHSSGRMLQGLLVTAVLLLLGPVSAVPGHAVADEPDARAVSRYVPLAPVRILDTRIGLGAAMGRPQAGAVLGLQVTGGGGVPADGVTAVVLNVVVTEPRQVGFVQVLPSGGGILGGSSNLNIDPESHTVANLVTVPVGADGAVSIYDVVGGHLVADVLGYFAPATTSAEGRYQQVPPTRVLDTRNRTGMPPLTPPPGPVPPPDPGDIRNCADFGTWADANAWFWTYYPHYGDVAGLDGDNDRIPCEALGSPGHPVPPPASPAPPPFDPYPRPAPGDAVHLALAGTAGIPRTGVSAVALTVTATESAAAGFVQVVPTAGATGLGRTSNVNLTAPGQTVANLVLVPLGVDGSVQVFTSSGADLIADVVGYFTGTDAQLGQEGLFVPLAPSRLLDSREQAAFPAGSESRIPMLGLAGIPTAGVSAVFLNVTATDTTGAGFLQVFPTGGAAQGASSTLNFTRPGQTVANAAVAGLGEGSTVSVFTPTQTHVVLDVFGYFTGSSGVGGDLLAGLVVAVPQPGVVYDRDTWRHWIDADGDCQDTRDEVLVVESQVPVTLDAAGCNVVAGLWRDPYTGLLWSDPADLDIDHVVALKNAHDSGGWAWDEAMKEAFANDLGFADHLIAVEDGVNQAKGALGPELWEPPSSSFTCTYATDWATIKTTWSLTVTPAEYDALARMLAVC